MYQIKIQGENYAIPESINDVSIGRFIKFRQIDPGNVLELVYWTLNARPVLLESNEVENLIANVLTLIQPTIDEMYRFFNHRDKTKTPEHIEVLGETIKLKGGLLNDLPYWPYVITKNIVINAIGKEAFDPTDDIPRVLAHYLYSYCTNREYTEKDAEEFIEVVNDIPMKEAIQLGNFFLSKHRSLFPSSKKLSRMKLSLTT